MHINIHRVESVSLKQEAHWQDKPDISFYVLQLTIRCDGALNTINLYSTDPLELTMPLTKVID